MPKVKRGEIWLTNLDPQTHKEEPAKSDRPCLVVQSDLLNEAGFSSVIVIPCTTDIFRNEEGDGFPLKMGIGKLQKPGEQPQETDLIIPGIRAISVKRLKGDQPIATLNTAQMKRVGEALGYVLTL